METIEAKEPSKALTVPKGSIPVKYVPGTQMDVGATETISDEELSELSEEEKDLKAKLEEITKAAQGLENELTDFSRQCSSHPTASPAVRLSNELDQTIALLRMRLNELKDEYFDIVFPNRKNDDGDDDGDVEEDFGEDGPEYVGPPPVDDDPVNEKGEPDEDPVKATRNERRLCKKLYLKIAARTHPDKTNDPVMHKIFLEAKSYLDRMMLTALQNLWDDLQGDRKSLKDRIHTRLKRLRERIAEEYQRLESMTGLGAYNLYKLSKETGLGNAAFVYREILDSQNANKQKEKVTLMDSIQSLEEEIRREKAESVKRSDRSNAAEQEEGKNGTGRTINFRLASDGSV